MASCPAMVAIRELAHVLRVTAWVYATEGGRLTERQQSLLNGLRTDPRNYPVPRSTPKGKYVLDEAVTRVGFVGQHVRHDQYAERSHTLRSPR